MGATKLPHLIRLQSGEPFAVAAVWGSWVARDGEVLDSASIITAPAEGRVAALHDRMPVVLAPDTYSTWLAPGLVSAALLKPGRIHELVTEPVSSAVNDVRNDSPACIAPPEPPQGRHFSSKRGEPRANPSSPACAGVIGYGER